MDKSNCKLSIVQNLHFVLFEQKHILLPKLSLKNPKGQSDIHFPKSKYLELEHVKQFVLISSSFCHKFRNHYDIYL